MQSDNMLRTRPTFCWNAGYDMDELYMFDIASRKWELIVPKGPKPGARYLHTAVVVKDSMVVFGGNDKECGDVWNFKFSNRRWTQLSKVQFTLHAKLATICFSQVMLQHTD